MKKRLLSIVLAFVLLLSIVVYAEPVQVTQQETGEFTNHEIQQEQRDYTARFLVKVNPAANAANSILQQQAVEAAQSESVPKAVATAAPQAMSTAAISVNQTVQLGQPAQVQTAQVSTAVGGLQIIELDTAVEPESFCAELEEKLGDSVEYIQPDYELYLSQTVELNLDMGESQTEAAPTPEAAGPPLPSSEPEQTAEPSITAEPAATDSPTVTETPAATPEAEATAEPTPDATATPEATATPINTAALLGNIHADIEAAHGVSTGAGVKVALIDSGMDVTHPDFAGRLVDGYDFVTDAALTYDPTDSMAQIHATHIAGLIAKTAPDAQLMPLKVFENGRAYTSDIIEAIHYAEAHGAQIVNCSFGRAADNPALRETIQGSGMLFVCAAGNDRRNVDEKPVYPASYGFDNVISVTSLNADMGFSYYSNYGTESVDIAAFGRDVESSYPGGGYGKMSGTSVSAGYVSGTAALALAAGAEDVKAQLTGAGYRLSNLGQKVNGSRMLSVYGAAAGIANEEISQVNPADDFDVHGYAPTPEENWELFSSLPNVQVESAHWNSFVLKEDGTVWAWGDNSCYDLGFGPNTGYYNYPVQIPGLTDITSLAGGAEHMLALKSDGTVWGWGLNNFGELGNVGSKTPAIQITGISNAAQIDAGNYISVILKQDGTVQTLGNNTYGMLGNLSSLNNVSQVKVGATQVIALKNDGTVWSWGNDSSIPYDSDERATPVQVQGLSGISKIEAGGSTGLAIDGGKTIMTWDGLTGEAHWISGLYNIEDVTAFTTGDAFLAIESDGTLWGWGDNNGGRLGDGTEIDRTEPVQAVGISGVVQAAIGYYHSIALDADGRIWTWGNNHNGVLGDSTLEQDEERLTPYCLTNEINGISTAVIYNGTYNGDDPFEGVSMAEKNNSITRPFDGPNEGYIKVDMATPPTQDAYFGVAGIDAPRYLVTEALLSSDRLGARASMEIKDANRSTGTLYKIASDGKVTSNASGKVLGSIVPGEWLKIAVALDTQEMKYATYVNGTMVEQNVPLGGISGVSDIRLYMGPNNTGSILLDNFRIYGGTEPREFDDDTPELFPNKGQIYFDADFNGDEPFDGADYLQKSNAITRETTQFGNGYLKIDMADPVTEDAYFGVAQLPRASMKKVAVEVSLSCDEGGVLANLELKDTRRDSSYLCFANGGSVGTAASEQYLGHIRRGQWLNLAFVLDLQAYTVTTYVNGEKREENLPIMGELWNLEGIRLYVRPDQTGDIFLDNFRVYELADSTVSEAGSSFENAIEVVKVPSLFSGRMDTAGTARYYKFTAPEDARYEVDLWQGYRMYPMLYQADAAQPTGYRLLAEGTEENSTVSCELEEGVTYYLKVEPSKTWANGNFTIRISQNELPADTPPPIRKTGVEYEQNTSSYTDLTPPDIHTVHMEILNFSKGIYRLTITDADYTLDSRGTPFFFWSAEEGTFSEPSEDYKSVIFTADENTKGRKVRVVVGMGDGLGQVIQKAILLDGVDVQ